LKRTASATLSFALNLYFLNFYMYPRTPFTQTTRADFHWPGKQHRSPKKQISMKKHLLYVLLFIFIIAGSSKAQQTTGTSTDKSNPATLKIKGAYAMLRQVAHNANGDSLMNSEQFKVYTDKYMIYVHPKMRDTLAEYGIGTYEIKNGKVIEYVFHTSENGARNDTFELNIYKIGDGYRQIIHFPADEGRSWTLIEDYMSVGKNATSPLDGAWKQTKVTYTAANGQKRTVDKPTQFKVYESGHFVWVNTSVDSARGGPVSYYGYGSFEMDGTTKSTEINASSTFRTDLIGIPVPIKLEFTGKDVYRQTITNPDGSKVVEEYRRMK